MQMQDYNSTILVNFTSTPGTYVLNRKKCAFAAAALCADFEHPGVYNPLLFDGQQCYEKDLLINGFIKDFKAFYTDKEIVETNDHNILATIQNDKTSLLYLKLNDELTDNEQLALADNIIQLSANNTLVIISIEDSLKYKTLYIKLKYNSKFPLRIFINEE